MNPLEKWEGEAKAALALWDKSQDEMSHDNARILALIDLVRKKDEALQVCDEFFTARDEMNSRVHLSSPRWSAITQLVKDTLELPEQL